MAKIYSLLVGTVLLVVGGLGFARPVMFGLPFYPAHNVLHVVTGLLGLWAGLSKGANGPRTFSQLFGAAYTLMAIAGFSGMHDLGSLHLGLDGNFNGIHLVLGLVGMLVGFAGPVAVVILGTAAVAGYLVMVGQPLEKTLEPSTPAAATLPGATSTPASSPAPTPTAPRPEPSRHGQLATPASSPAPTPTAPRPEPSRHGQLVTPASSPAPTPTALPGQTLRLGPPGDGVRLKLISGKLVQTRSDCSGVNPAQEFLGPLHKGKSDAKKELYIREGTVNSLSKPILREVSPDGEGNFEIVLPPGRYCVVGESKKDALRIPDLTEANKKLAQSRVPGEPFRIVSQQCFRDWWRTCDKILRVGNQNIRGFRVEPQQSCRPPCVVGGPPQH